MWRTCRSNPTGILVDNSAARCLKRARVQHYSTARQFYQNRQLDLYAAKEAKRLTLRQLVTSVLLKNIIGVDLHRVVAGVLREVNGRGTLDQSETVILSLFFLLLILPIRQSANYVRTELPVRIAHRLRDLQALPFIVVTQEDVLKVYEVCHLPVHARKPDLPHPQLYWSAFDKCILICTDCLMF